MSKRTVKDDSFTFSIAEETSDEVTIEIAPEDYQRQKAAGVEEELLLKPGRHKFIRGGFLKRHPSFNPDEPKEITVNVTLPISYDIFKYFEQRAAELQADSFKTLMAEALRQAMQSQNGTTTSAAYAPLLNDERFITAVAERVKTLTAPPKAASRKRKRTAKAKTKAA